MYKVKPAEFEALETLETIRQDYFEKIQDWFRTDHIWDRHHTGDGYDYREMIERCSTLQLRSICQLIDRKLSDLTLLRCNPRDHVAVTFAGIYVGIELDGYTHS